MPVRMTGMISNMDTESLIKGMMDAQRLKNKRVTDKQTLLTWKQEKWKELNTKLYKLYTDDLSKMRLQGNYQTKAITSSDENLATATGLPNSPEGSHKLTVDKLASSQYVTGIEITKTGADGKAISGSSKLVGDLGMIEGTQIKITTASGTKILDVSDTTTVDAFVQKCKEAGLSASYDTVQKRFFISSKSSGEANQFQITTFTDAALTNKRDIDSLVGYSSLNSTDRAKVEAAYQVFKYADPDKINAALTSTEVLQSDDAETAAIKNAVATLQKLTTTHITSQATSIATDRVKQEMTDAIKNGNIYAGVDYAGIYTIDTNKAKDEMIKKYNNPALDFSDPAYAKQLEKLVASKVEARVNSGITTDAAKTLITAKKDDIIANGTTVTTTNAEGVTTTTTIPSLTSAQSSLKTDIQAYSAGTVTNVTGQMSNLGLTELTEDSDGNIVSGDPADPVDPTKPIVTLIAASDSQITYNGAVLKGDSNVISANGLTITLKGLTEGKTVSLNVTNDTQKTYDMVKKFISSYNEILKEMNTLYDAPSTRGYAPLSDDEQESMTDSQIEKWEDKIKDSILRRDSTLESVMSSMKNAMLTSVEVDGKKYSLSSYGILTSPDYTEKGLLHIYGDQDDSVYSAKDDKLMAAIKNDPETVMEVLSGVAKNLYKEMDDKMKSIPNVRSAYTFYNDKLMNAQQTEYKKKIAALEDKLTEMEDKYYKQFSAMETALSRLQSQTNALSSMLGTSN